VLEVIWALYALGFKIVKSNTLSKLKSCRFVASLPKLHCLAANDFRFLQNYATLIMWQKNLQSPNLKNNFGKWWQQQLKNETITPVGTVVKNCQALAPFTAAI